MEKEQIEQLHVECISDLYNKINILNNNIQNVYNYSQQVEKELCDLREQINQEKKKFQHNLMYVEIVEDIVTSKETEWDGKVFNNMLVKLVDKDEIYKVFVQDVNTPNIGNKIKFLFNADENKLSQLKIIE